DRICYRRNIVSASESQFVRYVLPIRRGLPLATIDPRPGSYGSARPPTIGLAVVGLYGHMIELIGRFSRQRGSNFCRDAACGEYQWRKCVMWSVAHLRVMLVAVNN